MAKDLARTFAGPPEVQALRSGSLAAASGELVALMGRSGSGKSTLLTLLGLLDRPTSGRLSIEGQETTTLPDRMREQIRREQIGFVFQSFHLIPEQTAEANVALALDYAGVRSRRARETAAREALTMVSMSHRTGALAKTLSGGEQQRVAVARAIAKRPRLVLADEPTGNLDSASELMVMDLLRAVASGGAAVVVVTHSPEVASLCDRTVHMDEGVTRG